MRSYYQTVVKSILDFSDKPPSPKLLLDCSRQKRKREKWVEMPFNRREISGLWWQFCPNFESAPTSVSLFPIESAVAADFKTFSQFQIFVGMPYLHNQLHLQPNINLKISTNESACIASTVFWLVEWKKFSLDCWTYKENWSQYIKSGYCNIGHFAICTGN